MPKDRPLSLLSSMSKRKPKSRNQAKLAVLGQGRWFSATDGWSLKCEANRFTTNQNAGTRGPAVKPRSHARIQSTPQAGFLWLRGGMAERAKENRRYKLSGTVLRSHSRDRRPIQTGPRDPKAAVLTCAEACTLQLHCNALFPRRIRFGIDTGPELQLRLRPAFCDIPQRGVVALGPSKLKHPKTSH